LGQNCITRMHRPAALGAATLLLLTAGVRAQASPEVPSAAAHREITDDLGRTISVPQSVQRIVSLAPSMTEIVYALGLQDRLVGDTDYCDYPPEAKQKTKVGGGLNPSLETIASLHPDLVLVTKSFNRLETVHALETLGIPSYATDPHTVDAIISSTQHLANVLGAPEVAKTLASELERRLAEMERRVEALAPRRVLFVVWTEPLISIGKDTFISDALRHAGAVSVVDTTESWPQVNLEEVVRLQPEFLIFAESHYGAAERNLDVLAELPGWRLLEAVRRHRVAIISEAINRPAPRIVFAIEDLARQLHPEAYREDLDAPKEKIEKQEPHPLAAVFPDGFSLDSAHGEPGVLEASACAL
jgi:cobalamin transport system substrate-binding protein